MKSNCLKMSYIALFAVILCIGAENATAQATYKRVGFNENIKIKGVIATRSADSLTMRDVSSADMYYVDLSPTTKVQTYKKVLRGGDQFPASYLLRGLRIQVTGTGNADGHIIAKQIDFDPEDLRTAQALQVSVDPVEAQAEANRKKIEENEARIAATEENAKRMAGQIDEAQAMAAAAQASADRANNRINGLGDYDTIKTIVVPFATGSAALGPKGKKIIDEARAWVKTQDTKGWMISVIGFADSTGNSAKNKTLSEKRANAVIGYLVTKYGLPLTRLVQPFGAGADMPAAENTTAAGRAQNRRAEIKLLLNKGIAGD
ncbi:MAG: OmpA family protein [Pyrinomonadaceae bacterium]|nr:OmpA family protein [Pyrinomonadaceae bacterium]